MSVLGRVYMEYNDGAPKAHEVGNRVVVCLHKVDGNKVDLERPKIRGIKKYSRRYPATVPPPFSISELLAFGETACY